MGGVAVSAPDTWTDHLGVTRPTPKILGRLKFRIPLHAALRAFVHHRDGFACRICGVTATDASENYDGRHAIGGDDPRLLIVIDHIVSRRNGGSHHPSNLQTLCDSCNSRKAGLVDAKHGRAA